MKKLIIILFTIMLVSACSTTVKQVNSIPLSAMKIFNANKADTVLMVHVSNIGNIKNNIIIKQNNKYYKAIIVSGTDNVNNLTIGWLLTFLILTLMLGAAIGGLLFNN